ncbi:MAG: GIY-YIG nuclease family protein [Candidatus Paceibacterota bacterium]|jgi:putative endonuclease
MAYVYILKSLKYPKLYVGSTTNLKRRLLEHNSGLSYYTKQYMPWSIIYTEELANISDARKREKYFKSCAGRKFIKNKIVNIPG